MLKIYVSPSCSSCRKTKAFFKRRKIPFQEINIFKDLNYGDFVYFTDMSGNKFTYQVVEIETLKPTALDELLSGDWKLTLLTCTTGATARVVIRCELVLPQ